MLSTSCYKKKKKFPGSFNSVNSLLAVSIIEDVALPWPLSARPDQVELDVIIHKGDINLCEIKSSISKSEMHVFNLKKAYYEKKHGQRVSRAMVISPMIEPLAMKVARELDIETYSHADGVIL